VARSGPWRRRAGAAAWGGIWRRTPCRRWGRLRKGQALGEDMGSVAPRPWWCQYRGSFPHPCLRWWTAPIAAAARAWSRHRTCALAVSTPPWTKPNRRAQTAKSVSPIIGWCDVLGREALLQLNVHLCDVVEANRLMAGAWRHLPYPTWPAAQRRTSVPFSSSRGGAIWEDMMSDVGLFRMHPRVMHHRSHGEPSFCVSQSLGKPFLCVF
jgi:hypothetical protein